VFQPDHTKTACEPTTELDQEYAIDNKLIYNGFVLVESGECSYETKARNVERMGGAVALIIAPKESEVDSE